MDIIPICFHRPHDIAGATIQSTLSTHLSVKKAENDNVQKPTIFDIINETEKNQTKINQSIGRFVPQNEAINQKLNIGHPGVAEPLTWQQLEREMANDQKLRDSSTSKEGISTWILLSGSDQQQTASSPTPSATTIAAQVEKLEIQAPIVTEPPRRTNFRFQESQQTKLDKIGKIRQAIERRQGKPEKKNKPTVTSSMSTTITTSTESGELIKPISAVNETKYVRRKNPSFVQISKNNKRKPTGSPTITTTSNKPSDEEMTTIVSYIHGLVTSEEEGGETTTPVPFLVLEPKDADFDLPQDRSPGHSTKKPKRPTVGIKTKKKNGNKHPSNKKNPTNKLALNKQKEKPMSTKIYNYLSREVMPTVGVGLVGLVVTAGLASYFFGPLGALRRSYDDALDRQDTGDSIYAINSDEYASGNPDSGQKEEEVFGKFIAGMPANYMPKYVRYYQPQGSQPSYLQGHGPQGQGHQYPGQRHVYGPNNGQSPNGPKYNPQQQYFRNRNGAEFQKVSPSPHYNPVQYSQQQPVLRNHQPQPQQPLASPYIQQLHDLQMQKSLSTSIESALKQHTFDDDTSASYKTIPDDKSTSSDAPISEITSTPASIVVESNPELNTEGDPSNQIQRRIAHYVVGSVVSMDSKQVDEASSESTPAVASPEIITATHGPRRRRSIRMRRHAEAAEARFLQAKQNFENEVSHIDELYKQLQGKITRLNTNQSEDQNITKINNEYKKLDDNIQLLRLVVSHVKDIERFQKEFYIKSKNWELAMTLKTGMNHIRNQIILVSDLIDHPNDENLIKRIDSKENEFIKPSTSPNERVDVIQSADGTQTHFSPLDDLFKLFQLKALFGFNLLQNIRPSFERAFEEVFRVPAREKID